MHENDHIDLLVSLALRVGAKIRAKDAIEVGGYWMTTVGDDLDPSDLGRLLLAENLRSVQSRYGDYDEGFDGEECFDEADANEADPEAVVASYKFQPVDLEAADFNSHWSVAGIKAAKSLAYQSCEHPEWERSEARRWLDAIMDATLSHIPSWSEANTWQWRR